MGYEISTGQLCQFAIVLWSAQILSFYKNNNGDLVMTSWAGCPNNFQGQSFPFHLFSPLHGSVINPKFPWIPQKHILVVDQNALQI